MTGWSLKRIEYETERRKWGGFEDPDRYHPARDLGRQQDWEWAVDRLARRMDIAPPHRSAAWRFYNAKMALLGDIAPDPRGMAGAGTETALERAARIYWGGRSYVAGHPDLTTMREATFERLFRRDQPTLEQVRAARAGAQRGRTKQGEAIGRIRWCCEVLANHFDGQGYEEAAVNEKQMGVGEGWVNIGHRSTFPANFVTTLQGRGYDLFEAPSGNVYARNPKVASAFQPLDATPQIGASKA